MPSHSPAPSPGFRGGANESSKNILLKTVTRRQLFKEHGNLQQSPAPSSAPPSFALLDTPERDVRVDNMFDSIERGLEFVVFQVDGVLAQSTPLRDATTMEVLSPSPSQQHSYIYDNHHDDYSMPSGCSGDSDNSSDSIDGSINNSDGSNNSTLEMMNTLADPPTPITPPSAHPTSSPAQSDTTHDNRDHASSDSTTPTPAPIPSADATIALSISALTSYCETIVNKWAGWRTLLDSVPPAATLLSIAPSTGMFCLEGLQHCVSTAASHDGIDDDDAPVSCFTYVRVPQEERMERISTV
eukprot:TRINITY_DN2656_c0_g1_i2.p1 TRINITY_DN2656_c0_g1~~TRINITY_DN2656_c0_g1_i2.p1  ORF type:complete len:299 (+),score=65.69 TRINITY_DN2656_c0_g1_i2:155-1051(+)